MTDWNPISRVGHPTVPGETRARRMRVNVELSSSPPHEWTQNFVGQYAAVHEPEDDWPLPEVRGSTVVLWPLDDDLASWIEIMEPRIEHSNAYYRDHVIPDEQRRLAAAKEVARAQEARLEAARRKAEQL